MILIFSGKLFINLWCQPEESLNFSYQCQFLLNFD